MMRILNCGDSALTVEFGDTIDAALNDRALALDGAIAHEEHAAIVETVPTYRSLMVHYDPCLASFAELSSWLDRLTAGLKVTPRVGERWRIPVVYGEAFGEDLVAVAKRHGLTPDEVVARHTAGEYRVYMIGFTPGYTYLGGLDARIATPRRPEPRLSTPSGSISIGGGQAAIQCLAAPSGWHLLGRTPVRTYHPGRDPMFLLQPGNRISFYAIPAAEWDSLDRAACHRDGEPWPTCAIRWSRSTCTRQSAKPR
jgi:KipI family sensor histidine kinase inhibitor